MMKRERDVAVAVALAVAAAPQRPEAGTDSRRTSSASTLTACRVNCKHDPVRSQSSRQSVIQLLHPSLVRRFVRVKAAVRFIMQRAAAAHAACERYLSCSIVPQLLLLLPRP